MNLNFLLIFLPTVVVAQHTIKGNFSPPEDYEWAILYKITPATSIYIDNVQVNKKGSFEFQLDSTATQGMYKIVYALPQELLTPNGIVVTADDTIWLADTTSSFFFNFDPSTEEFTHYVTSDPQLSTYGNQTGIVKSPISRPYWIDADDQGRLVFNEQTSNNIAVMDPKLQSLVEYHVPSKNPNWADCDPGTGMMLPNCGLAQIFDFTIDGEKIWFTEWVENNIGVVDTSVPLPIEIQLESDTLILAPGETQNLNFIVSPNSQKDMLNVSLVMSTTHEFLNVNLVDNSPSTFQLDFDAPRPIHITISASEDAVPGTYKILLGAQSPDVAISKYVTVTIE